MDNFSPEETSSLRREAMSYLNLNVDPLCPSWVCKSLKRENIYFANMKGPWVTMCVNLEVKLNILQRKKNNSQIKGSIFHLFLQLFLVYFAF